MTPLVVLSAGPGWGKTTLLAEWASRSQRPFAWVHVDQGDDDPVVFLTYVAVALDRVSRLDPGVFEALASPGASLEGTIVPRLGAALANVPQALVLVLDDLHLIQNRACLDAVAVLARHVPEGSQLAISARGAPSLPLGALRAHGLELEILQDDLRMNEAQADLLLRAAGVDLPDSDVAELTEHTEGWSAGLYLAALSIRARGSKAEGVAPFSGSDRLVSDYLRSEMLEHLSEDEIRFLTRTAVLERMSGPLCDAVLEGTGSAAILERLSDSNLFLIPLGGDGEWFRYHHLFRELLRSELDRADPELARRLLGRAADWCAEAGQPETAIAYAQEARDVDRVARLVEQATLPTYQSGRAATVELWLDWLERHGALEQNAAVSSLGALIAAIWGRPAEADRRSDAAERASYEGSLPDGSATIESWLAHLRALGCRRGIARMRTDAELALETLARTSFFRPNAALFLALSLWLAGETDRADDLFADVAEEGLELGATEAAAVALAERSAIAIGREEWDRAEELADRSLRLIRLSRMDEYPTSALVCALAARVAVHRGETKRAHELLGRAQRLRTRLTYALPYMAVQARLELARAYLALADAAGAETILREVDGLLRRQPDLGLLPSQASELGASVENVRVKVPGASSLTEAELRVLPYLATHLAFREVGERLYLSRHTVKSHAVAIYRKLSVSSRNGAVDRARELGLL